MKKTKPVAVDTTRLTMHQDPLAKMRREQQWPVVRAVDDVRTDYGHPQRICVRHEVTGEVGITDRDDVKALVVPKSIPALIEALIPPDEDPEEYLRGIVETIRERGEGGDR